jgi:hypothetical protein
MSDPMQPCSSVMSCNKVEWISLATSVMATYDIAEQCCMMSLATGVTATWHVSWHQAMMIRRPDPWQSRCYCFLISLWPCWHIHNGLKWNTRTQCGERTNTECGLQKYTAHPWSILVTCRKENTVVSGRNHHHWLTRWQHNQFLWCISLLGRCCHLNGSDSYPKLQYGWWTEMKWAMFHVIISLARLS